MRSALPGDEVNANRLCVAVDVCSPVYGDCCGVLHDLNAGEALVEMPYAPPIGEPLLVIFRGERASMGARAVVQSHLNSDEPFGLRMFRFRFVEFVDSDHAAAPS